MDTSLSAHFDVANSEPAHHHTLKLRCVSRVLSFVSVVRHQSTHLGIIHWWCTHHSRLRSPEVSPELHTQSQTLCCDARRSLPHEHRDPESQ